MHVLMCPKLARSMYPSQVHAFIYYYSTIPDDKKYKRACGYKWYTLNVNDKYYCWLITYFSGNKAHNLHTN